MIAKRRERMGKQAIERLKPSKHARSLRNPGLGGARWYCHTDPKALLQSKPGRKCASNCRPAMIDNPEFSLGQLGRSLIALASPERQVRSPAQHLHHHFARA